MDNTLEKICKEIGYKDCYINLKKHLISLLDKSPNVKINADELDKLMEKDLSDYLN